MNTPTPETDDFFSTFEKINPLITDFASKLEQERDQLRKVADELANRVRFAMEHGTRSCGVVAGNSLLSYEQHKIRCVYHLAMTHYEQLPHVIARTDKPQK